MMRVLPYASNNAYMNMAIDHTLLESVSSEKSPMALRLYRWEPGAVSIGRFQSMEREVNTEKCKALGIDFVRRITGGGAVYHDSDGEITYSIIAKEKELPKGIPECYKCVSGFIIKALSNLGIRAEFAPINDITVNGKKISGNAQTRKEGAVLQHGTILYKAEIRKMFAVLNVSGEKLSDKMISSAEERVTDVASNSKATMGQLHEELLRQFTEGKDPVYSELTNEEKERAVELAETVYGTKEWNFSR